MSKFAVNDATRALVWSHLVVYPGLTANEIGRAVFRTPKGASTLSLCQRMERDGQLIGKIVFRPQQGRDVTCWYAVPGVFTL